MMLKILSIEIVGLLAFPFVLFAVGAYIAIVYNYLKYKRSRRLTRKILSVITEFREVTYSHRSGDDFYTTTAYRPMIEYEFAGRIYKSFSKRDYDEPIGVGDNIPIWLNPYEPEDFEEVDNGYGFGEFSRTKYILIGLGFVAFAVMMTILFIPNFFTVSY